jgi:hypothetical protein
MRRCPAKPVKGYFEPGQTKIGRPPHGVRLGPRSTSCASVRGGRRSYCCAVLRRTSAHAAALPLSPLLLGKGSEWPLWLEKDAFIWTRFGAHSGHPTALNIVAGQSRLAFGAGRDKTKSIPHPNNPSYPVPVRNKEALSF